MKNIPKDINKKMIINYRNTDLEYLLDYDIDVPNRIIYLYGEIEETSSMKIMQVLKYFETISICKPITIVVSSFGGSTYDGLALIDAIENCKCKIITIGIGPVMSMATYIFVAGDERRLHKRSTIMTHQGKGGSVGKTSDIEIEAKEMKRLEKLCNEYLASKSKKSESWWEDRQKRGDVYIDPHKSIEYGLADFIIGDEKKNGRKNTKRNK